MKKIRYKTVGECGAAIFGGTTSGALAWMAEAKAGLVICGETFFATNPYVLAFTCAAAGGCLMYGLAKMITRGVENDKEKERIIGSDN